MASQTYLGLNKFHGDNPRRDNVSVKQRKCCNSKFTLKRTKEARNVVNWEAT